MFTLKLKKSKIKNIIPKKSREKIIIFFFIHKVKNKIIKIIGNNKIKPINLFLTKKYFITSKKSLMTIAIYPYIKLKL